MAKALLAACWRNSAIAALMLLSMACLPASAIAQSVAVDFSNSTSGTSSTGQWKHEVGTDTDRFLVIAVSIEGTSAEVATIDYAGLTPFFIGERRSSGTTGPGIVQMYGLLDPPSGVGIAEVTLTSSARFVAGSTSFANVDQNDPISAQAVANGNSSNASLSIGSATGEMVFAALVATGDIESVSTGSGQTQRWNRSLGDDNALYGVASTEPGAVSTTMSYSLDAGAPWAMVAISIQPPSPVDFSVLKTSMVTGDPVSGASNPKAIPGAVLKYCILISNAGTADAENVVSTDTIPTDMTYSPGSMLSGASCASATDPEDDDASGTDESDPWGASISGSTITMVAKAVGPSSSMALTFEAIVD